MLRAILFDMGGTLDGNGLHWLDRFAGVYADAGMAVPFETLRAAFDHAERQTAVVRQMCDANLHHLVERHVAWQFEHLGFSDEVLRDRIAGAFEQSVRAAAAPHVALLSALHSQGLQLGVVSNACGNVSHLCDDFGFSPFLTTVVDSWRVGVAKPDPRIYRLALERIAQPAHAVLMVGDSFDRDVLPAKAIGMKTAWLHGGRPCPDLTAVDFLLASLEELPAALTSRTQVMA